MPEEYRYVVYVASVVLILLAALENRADMFLTGRNYPSGEYPVSAAVRDFDNDGIADILGASQNDKNVSVSLGNDDGLRFGKPRPLAASMTMRCLFVWRSQIQS